MGGKVVLTAGSFQEEVLDVTSVVLVDFHAQWCPPCKAMAPIIEEIVDDYDGRVKVCALDVDEAGDIVARYNVTAIPTFIVFKGGKPLNTLMGSMSKDALTHALDEIIGG